MYKCLMGGKEDKGVTLLPGMSSDRTKGKEHRINHKIFHVKIRKSYCYELSYCGCVGSNTGTG